MEDNSVEIEAVAEIEAGAEKEVHDDTDQGMWIDLF